MPSLPDPPDIPGKSLVKGGGRRVGKVAAGAGLAVIGIGGYVARRMLRRREDDGEVAGASADPIAETPTAPPGAQARAPEPESKAPKPNPAKPKAPKPAPKAEKPKPAKPKAPEAEPKAPKAEKPKPAKPAPKAEQEKPEPPAPQPTKPEPPELAGKDPHHALNNAASDPDPTEWPDPYEKRRDPLDPEDPDGEPFGEEPHPATGAGSTSEPHRGKDLEAGDREERTRERDKLDD